jgi:hypothetical protein
VGVAAAPSAHAATLDGDKLAAQFLRRAGTHTRSLHLSRSESYLQQGYIVPVQLADRVQQMDRVDRDPDEIERQLRSVKLEADAVLNNLKVQHSLDESIEILEDEDVHSHRTRADSEFYGRTPGRMPPPLGQEKLVWDMALELGPAMQLSLFKRLRLHLAQLQMIDEPITRTASLVDLAALDSQRSSQQFGSVPGTSPLSRSGDALPKPPPQTSSLARNAVPPPPRSLPPPRRANETAKLTDSSSDSEGAALMNALLDAERKMGGIRHSPRRARSPDGRRRSSGQHRARSKSPPTRDTLNVRQVRALSPRSGSGRREPLPRDRRELSPRMIANRTHRELSPRGRAASPRSPISMSPRPLSPRANANSNSNRRRDLSPQASPRHPSSAAPTKR